MRYSRSAKLLEDCRSNWTTSVYSALVHCFINLEGNFFSKIY